MTVYDRTKEKAREVGQRGAYVAQTPKDLGASCQIIKASVTDDRAQREVMFGPNGVLAGVHSGPILIDLSTVSPDASSRLFQASKEKNVAMIDAAVSGSVPQVDQGNLVIFVGGEHKTFEQCKPILDVTCSISSSITCSITDSCLRLDKGEGCSFARLFVESSK